MALLTSKGVTKHANGQKSFPFETEARKYSIFETEFGSKLKTLRESPSSVLNWSTKNKSW